MLRQIALPIFLGIGHLFDLRHALHAAGYDHIRLSGQNGVGAGGNGLQAGGAEPGQGLGTDAVRQTRPLHDHSGELPALALLRIGAAHDHVVDLRAVQLRHPRQHPFQGLGAQIDGMGAVEHALGRLSDR